jgi:hypothetical protein
MLEALRMSAIFTSSKKSFLCILACLAFFGAALPAHSQDRWGLQDRYLTVNDKPVFLSGANYIPSQDWYFILKDWKPDVVERDMAALHKLGITTVRFPPFWNLTQPTPDTVDPVMLTRLNELLTIAHRNGIAVQVEPFTGGICSASYLPEWAAGDLFADPKIVQGERKLVSEMVRSVKDNPGLMGYDFGNEVDILLRYYMKLNTTPEQSRRWAATIYQAFHEADPRHAVTNGLGSIGGKGENFGIWDVAESSDYMSVHSYAFFDNTIKYDPWVGQRTLYDMNYAVARAAMPGKAVLVQENGFSEAWVGSKDEIAKCLRISLMSAWAQGAAGYFWWGSHDNDINYRIPTNLITLKYSQPSLAQGIMNQLEYSEGLLDIDNQPKSYGLEYQHWNTVIEKLGLGWKNDLPVLYVLYPDDIEKGDEPARVQLTAFTLAKQTHMEVRLWPQWKPVPSDAAGVVIANFGLSEKGKSAIGQYLEKGGAVYQSWVNDFAGSMDSRDSSAPLSSPAFIVTTPPLGVPARNRLPIQEGEHVRINAPVTLKNIAPPSDPQTQVLLWLAGSDPQAPLVRPAFFKTSVGKGTYYYLAANLEEALARTYNPWDQDDSNMIYSVLRPETPVSIDSKFVELYVKSRGAERIFLLLNRSDRFQDVVLRSAQDIRLQDFTTHAPLGAGKEIPLRLMPGEVLIAQPN